MNALTKKRLEKHTDLLRSKSYGHYFEKSSKNAKDIKYQKMKIKREREKKKK